ncbi:MAG: hypothetical protein HC913_19255 [Microscillaceae bacterium]|nr:hypothetical protein [Microscillaceae bacterium]
MQVSIDISLYPLQENYEAIILAFIAQLQQYPALELTTNGMSTQVFGAIEAVFPALQAEMQNIYERYPQAVLVMKMGKGRLTGA